MKILDKNTKVKDNKVILTKTTEEELSRGELDNLKLNIKRQKYQLIEQNTALQNKFEILCEKEIEIDEMIKLLPNQEVEEVK